MSSSSSGYSDRFIDWTNEILDNRYILIKKMGYGSYASVWLCYDVNDMKYYAIKINNREDYKVAVKESNTYNIVKTYKSPYIMSLIRTFDHNEDGKYRCFIMELMACSIYDVIKIHKTGLKFEYVIKCAYQIFKGLNDLHRHNIIHGDIKPENLLLVGNNSVQKDLFKKLELGKIIKSKIRNKNGFSDSGTQRKIIKELEKRLLEFKKNNPLLFSSSENSDDENNESDVESEIGVIDTFSISSCGSNDNYSYDSYDSDSSDDDKKIGDENTINELLNQIHIKITDMGNTIMPSQKKRCSIQTCYYRSPEILLGINYDESSDIWATGCTIYEMLTGNILFDAEDYDGNTKRHHLFLMVKKLGMIPRHLIENSPNRDIFFTNDNSFIKGYKNIDLSNPLWKDLQNISRHNNLNSELEFNFITFMLGILNHDPKKRLTANDALLHPLFKLCKLC